MKVTRTTVFEHTERYPFNGITTLALSPSGELLLGWYAGTWEAHPDNVILMARSLDEGRTWSEPEVIQDTPGRADRDPELFYVGDTLHLVCNSPIFIYQQSSKDDGRTWSQRRQIPGHALENVATCEPFALKDDSLLFPYSFISEYAPSFGNYTPAVYRSEDGAKHWTSYAIPMPEGVEGDEPTVTQLRDESLLCFIRTATGKAYRSRSFDCGRTWTLAEPSEFNNPDSNHDLRTLSDGRLAYVYNDSPNKRWPLVVRFSEDDGKSWSEAVILDDSQAECGYPTAIEAFGKLLGAYHYKKEDIRLVICEL